MNTTPQTARISVPEPGETNDLFTDWSHHSRKESTLHFLGDFYLLRRASCNVFDQNKQKKHLSTAIMLKVTRQKISLRSSLLRAPHVARNPNLHVIITHASHVCGQHLCGLPLRMYGMHRTQFDRVRLDLLLLVIWSQVFWPSLTWNLLKAQR